ncbi:four helix bundle protein [Flavobacterium difficile]|nr:four helix bundle protein [Flavobacterium difficile]
MKSEKSQVKSVKSQVKRAKLKEPSTINICQAMKENDLLKRTFNFGVDCLKYLRKLETNPENNLVRFQLGKSCTSIGANYEASQAGSSKADFINKVKISLREARESNYWLRILKELTENKDIQLEILIQESKEIKNILSAIVNHSNKK